MNGYLLATRTQLTFATPHSQLLILTIDNVTVEEIDSIIPLI